MAEASIPALSAKLAPLDWAVIGAYAVGTLGIGWWYGRRNANATDYLVGGRTMNPVAVGLSFFVAIFSTITYLAIPGEVVRHGPIILAGLLAYPLVFLITGWLIIPTFMRLRVASGYELLETRLGPAPRLLGASLFILMRLMWMGVIVFATVDKVLVPILALPAAATPWLCALLAGLTIVYTAMGGLKAIVTVDVIQACLLFGGIIISLALITRDVGGVGQWWPTDHPAHWQPVHFFHGPGGERTLMAAFVATFVWFVCTAGSDQMAVQRYLSTRDARAARKMFAVSLFAGAAIQIILGLLGLALLAYATLHPSLLDSDRPIAEQADRLFPRFIATALPSGLAGLVIAGLLAEAMNSLSSGINGASAVVSNDFLARLRRAPLAPAQELRTLRWISVVVGLTVVALSIGVGSVQGNLLELAYKVVNLLTAPLFSLFFLAMFIPWATGFGALTGAATGLAVTILINYWREISGALRPFGAPLPAEPIISFLWGTPLSFCSAALVGLLVSLVPIGLSARERARAAGTVPP